MKLVAILGMSLKIIPNVAEGVLIYTKFLVLFLKTLQMSKIKPLIQQSIF